MFRAFLTTILLTLISLSLQAATFVEYTSQVLADDANGIAEDQTLGAAGNLTLNGALVGGGAANLNEAQIVAFESSGNLSAVTFTITGRDADGTQFTEDVTGPNATTVKSTAYFKSITQIAADGAVGTNVEVGVLAADGMQTQSFRFDNWDKALLPISLGVELSAGTGTFGIQYSLDNPKGAYTDTYLVDGSWRDAVSLDPDVNTTTGEDNIIAPVRAVRGMVTTGSTTGVYKFKVLQADQK